MTAKRVISKVLDLKRFTQEQLEAEVKKVNDSLGAEAARLENLKKIFMKTEERFKTGQTKGTLRVSEVGLFYEYLSFLGRQIEQQEGVVTDLHKELEEKRNEMVDIYREKRIFEKFRDKIVHEESRRTLIVEQDEADYDFISKRLRE